jgi:hypothetical protein
MRRVLAAAVTLTVLAGMETPATARQDGVRLMLTPATLTRDRTTVLEVRIQIPEGRFIPAETRGDIQGAWMRPDDSLVSASRLPTWPMPSRRLVGAADASMLTYTDAITVRLPVHVPPGVRGAWRVGIDFGYQLCDPVRCELPRVAKNEAVLTVAEPPAPAATLAFRVDEQRVAILLDRRATHDRALPTSPLAARVMPLIRLAQDHPALAAFPVDGRAGARRTLVSNGASFVAIAEQPAALAAGCEDDMPLALVARVQDTRFARHRSKYFLALPSGGEPGAERSLTIDATFSASTRQRFEQLVNDQMRITLPSAFPPKRELGDRLAPQKTAADRRFENGEGRLTYHVETFALAPDGFPRLYVRAYWTVGARSQIGMTLWMRRDGENFAVEHTDTSITTASRMMELKEDLRLAANSHYAGILLNVVPADDGWAYLLMGQGGYEYWGVSALKYTPLGPMPTGIHWGHGC